MLKMPGVDLFKQGKVRDVYVVGNKLLFVATDRISAFDVVMKNGIPGKGRVLNLLSEFWFKFTKDIADNHMITTDIDAMIKQEPALEPFADKLDKRSMLVKKAETLPVECIVRGYLSGSAWKEYQKTATVCGMTLPHGFKESDKLPEPIFTPSTKAEEGHDINISEEEAKKIVGAETYDIIKQKSIEVYKKAADYAESKGIIIADTKFEFGKVGSKYILVDEVLTPDSSRFWPKEDYARGASQKSFDKQFVRDYLEAIGWDKTPPGPELPEAIVNKTVEKYEQAYKILTGMDLPA